MIDHRRRDFAAGNHFSFTNPIRAANDDPDEDEFIAWVEGIKGGNSYFGKSHEQLSSAWASRSPRNYNSHDDGRQEFRWVAKDDDDSDVPSPKLWEQAAGSPATQSAKASLAHSRRYHYQPTSRAQVISRYRQEMMDLVRDAPESAYELSLKDMVELPRVQGTPEKVKEQKAGKKRTTRRMSRSESMDAGVFLLKMFFPFSIGGKSRKRSSGGTSSKVSPKPISGGGAERSTDGDWSNKSKHGGRSSSSSGSSNRSIISSGVRKLTGCYSFFLAHKSEAGRI